MFFEDLLHKQRPILLGPLFCDFQHPLASERFIDNEEVGAPLFLIAVVFPCHLSRLRWFGRIFVLDEILSHLIHTDSRNGWIIGLTVDIEDILHMIDKICIGFLWKAPGFFEPGFQLVFLSVVLTVSGLMCSTYSSCTIRSASSRTVQR